MKYRLLMVFLAFLAIAVGLKTSIDSEVEIPVQSSLLDDSGERTPWMSSVLKKVPSNAEINRYYISQ